MTDYKNKYSILNKTLCDMKVSLGGVIFITIGVILLLMNGPIIYRLITGAMAFNPGFLIFLGIAILFLLIGILLCAGKAKKDYIKLLLDNTKELNIVMNEDGFLKEINDSLGKNPLYKTKLLIVNEEFFISWGEDDLKFKPVAIPRNIIKDITPTKQNLGYGSMARTNMLLQVTLDNDMKINLLISGAANPGPLNKLLELNIVK